MGQDRSAKGPRARSPGYALNRSVWLKLDKIALARDLKGGGSMVNDPISTDVALDSREGCIEPMHLAVRR